MANGRTFALLLLLLLLLHVAAAQIVCAASEKFAGNKVIYLILVYFILLTLPLHVPVPLRCLHYFLAISLLKLATVAQQFLPLCNIVVDSI